MDQGMGACLLRDSNYAKLVAETLLHFDGERHQVDSFVIMPNHVHILAQVMPEFSLEKTVQSWKRFSARRINEHRGQNGSLWHKRYWDRLVRSEEHFWKIRRYILRNPGKANLPTGQYLLYAPWHQVGGKDPPYFNTRTATPCSLAAVSSPISKLGKTRTASEGASP